MVGFNGLYAEMQLFGDLPGAVALPDQAEDLQFPIREFFHRGTFSAARAPDELVHHLLRNAIADIHLAAQNLPNGDQDPIRSSAS